MWSQVDRLGEHALPTLMKKVARHAVSALAGLEWLGRRRARLRLGEQRQHRIAGDRQADRRKGPPVMAGHPESANRFAMLRCRVADIGAPSIDRIARRESRA